MITKIIASELQKSLRAAEALQAELCQSRLLGIEKGHWLCVCGKNHFQRAKAVDIIYPQDDNADAIGLWSKWAFKMEVLEPARQAVCLPECKYNAMPLNCILSQAELFPLFRKYFAGIDVPMERPSAFIQYANGSAAGISIPKGELVEVALDQPVQMQVKGDAIQHPFNSLEFCLTRAWGEFRAEAGSSLALLRTEPYQKTFYGNRETNMAVDNTARIVVAKCPIYSVRIEQHKNVDWVPVFAIVRLDAAAGQATIRLAENLELIGQQQRLCA